MTRSIDTYIELPLSVEYDHTPAEKPTRDYPGVPEEAEITDCKILGHSADDFVLYKRIKHLEATVENVSRLALGCGEKINREVGHLRAEISVLKRSENLWNYLKDDIDTEETMEKILTDVGDRAEAAAEARAEAEYEAMMETKHESMARLSDPGYREFSYPHGENALSGGK